MERVDAGARDGKKNEEQRARVVSAHVCLIDPVDTQEHAHVAKEIGKIGEHKEGTEEWRTIHNCGNTKETLCVCLCGIDLREEGHQEIVLLEVSHTAVVPEPFGLVTVALD